MAESPFSSSLPTLQVAWDQTSMSSLQTCPRKYQYEIILGWVPRSEPINFVFGRIYHSALEAYDKAIALEERQVDAQDKALNEALKASWDWKSEDKYKNRDTLIRTVVWYIDRYENDPIKTVVMKDGNPAVELSFRYDLNMRAITGDQYILTGHIDRLIDHYGEIMPEERKTTKSALDQNYWKTFTPGLQITWYIFGSQVILPNPSRKMLVSSAQVAVGFSTFGRHPVKRNPDDFEEFQRDVSYHLTQAERFAEDNYWPKNERNCWICPFKTVCAMPKDLRDNALQADFTRRFWNPLETR